RVVCLNQLSPPAVREGGQLMADLDTVTLPVLPLTDDVVLPGMVVTLALETSEAKAAADAAAKAGNTLLLVPRLGDGRYARVGTVARIENQAQLPGGMPALVIRATVRAEVGLGVIGETSGLWVHASPVDDGEVTDEVAERATELRAAVRAPFDARAPRPCGPPPPPPTTARSPTRWPSGPPSSAPRCGPCSTPSAAAASPRCCAASRTPRRWPTWWAGGPAWPG